MRKIVNIFLIFIFLIIIAGCILPSFLPKNIEFQISKNFNNPISQVYLEFNDLENYGTWGAWITEDSINTKVNYFSPYKGVGSSITWSNKKDDDIGSGEYRIIKSTINRYIQSQVIFIEENVICLEDIFFKSNNETTKVTIKLKTDNFSYFSRIFAYLYANRFQENMENSLNRLSTKLNKNDNTSKNLTVGETAYIDFEGIQLLAIKNETTTDVNTIYTSMDKSLNEITEFLTDSLRYIPSDIRNPIAYYTKFDTLNQSAIFYAGYPIKSNNIPHKSNMQIISIPSGKAIFTPIKGNIDNIIKARYTLNEYSKENQVNLKYIYWEEYQDYPISKEDEFKGNSFYLLAK